MSVTGSFFLGLGIGVVGTITATIVLFLNARKKIALLEQQVEEKAEKIEKWAKENGIPWPF